MKKYYIAMAIVVAITVVSIAGYYLTFANTVRDTVKEQDISTLSTAVNDYVSANKRLPESLDQVKLTSSIKRHLDRYTYKKVGKYTDQYEDQLRYQLCTDFKSQAAQSRPLDVHDSEYQSYVDTYSHGSGPTCFKLYAYVPRPTNELFKPVAQNSASIGTGSVLARDTQRKSDLRTLKIALESYYADNGYYPAAATWKTDLLSGTTPYAKTIPTDPLTHAEYAYAPAPANCKTTCASYTLTAQLENKNAEGSDGSGHYVLSSAN